MGKQEGKYERRDRGFEEEHLLKCSGIIQKNVEYYRNKAELMAEEMKVMYDNYRSDNPELHNELVIESAMYQQVLEALRKNETALEKPYFGRIDYQDKEDGIYHTLYLGKNGVMKSNTELLVADWRAPVSGIYYESQVGESSYLVPEQGERFITLELKRTYEIIKRELAEFYDAEVIANDELLTKYLAKNKEAVLGEIIATIQKEQNDIIRQTPFRNTVVQGVAGSGKTTVAMHRISYILYNYSKKFLPSEFYIIGSNRMLLNYITGVLPDLDVHGVNQVVMEEFLQEILDKDFKPKKYQILQKGTEEGNSSFLFLKGSLEWLEAQDEFMDRLEASMIPEKDIEVNGIVIYRAEGIRDFLENNRCCSTQEKINQLNKRLVNKLRNYYEMHEEEKETVKKAIRQYRSYFGASTWKRELLDVYTDFILEFREKKGGLKADMDRLLSELHNNKLDIYDMASLCYMKNRLKATEQIDDVRHIVVDEAQDFGVMIFGVLKRILPKATFTIMGDVSQNINYHSGMNDWEALRNKVFSPETDRFHILAKSYRNTVEISKFAENILRHCTFKTYEIEPIIRHGKEVELLETEKGKALEAGTEIIKRWQKEGYDTIAVICRTNRQAAELQKNLKEVIKVEETDFEHASFTQGVMVLPVQMTKGLEFDAALLWQPTEENYAENDANAKLLYVAATRALHELKAVYCGTLTPLLRVDAEISL